MIDTAAFLRRLAAAAAEQTLPRFRAANAVSNKLESGFDPVTEADREAERVIRAMIEADFPGDGIVGEEFGTVRPDAPAAWVIDPVDGTRAFISGLPLWGTLVGRMVEGRAVAGMMSQPFTGELYFADGAGAHYEGPGEARRLAVRPTQRLDEASVCTTSPALFKGEGRAAYDLLESACRFARYGTDCYAFAMLASGHVDLVVEAGLQPYDIVALIPIVEQAGGIVTRLDGGRAEAGGDVIAAATPRLHEAALVILNGR